MKNKSKNKGQNNRLYTDDNPQTTIKGMGFADKEKAMQTISILENLESHASWNSEKEKQIYIQQVLVTMYYRAKHHPHRTRKMEEAMQIFKDYAFRKKLNIDLS